MDKEKGLLNGKFKALPDGSLDKNTIIYYAFNCRYELSYHWSMSSLKQHLLAKHTANAESPPPPRQRQTMLDS